MISRVVKKYKKNAPPYNHIPRSSEAGTTSPVKLLGRKISPEVLAHLTDHLHLWIDCKDFGLQPFLPLALAAVRPD
jgi:hypothetical protein